MDKLHTPGLVRSLTEKYGFRVSKSLGQNFLMDQHIVDQIIKGSNIDEASLVIEIGPGLGVLTAAAAKKAGKVVAIEIDKKLLPILKETLGEYPNVEVIQGDILKTDLLPILEQNQKVGGRNRESIRVMGNLPYYITTPIIMKLLEERLPLSSITIMMQKEVGERIAAQPGTKAYGALSLAVQYYATVTQVSKVSREVFFPKPNVDSIVLRLDLRKEAPVSLENEQLFFDVIKAGFSQRRKTLRNTLSGLASLSREELEEAMEAAGIDPGRRGETLSMEEFAALSNQIDERSSSKLPGGSI